MTTTTERSWSTIDKSDWGDGPWQGEPDKVQWIDEATGLDCLIHRGPMGNLCGYVGVPPEHPCHGKHYDDVSVFEDEGRSHPTVHGGLTYSNACQDTEDESHGICHVPEPGRPHDVWWLGFDCGHSMDICPGYEARAAKLDGCPSLRFGGESYKTVAYVKRECASLAQQLAALA